MAPEHISLHNAPFIICIRNTRNTHGTLKCQLTNVNGFWPNKITTGNHKKCIPYTSVQLDYIVRKKEEFCLFNIGLFGACMSYMNSAHYIGCTWIMLNIC